MHPAIIIQYVEILQDCEKSQRDAGWDDFKPKIVERTREKPNRLPIDFELWAVGLQPCYDSVPCLGGDQWYDLKHCYGDSLLNHDFGCFKNFLTNQIIVEWKWVGLDGEAKKEDKEVEHGDHQHVQV